MKRITALILSLLVSAVLLNPADAAATDAAVGRDTTIVTCNSPMMKALMSTPVRVPQRDLAVPASVLGQLRVQYWALSGCQSIIERATYHSLLLEYVENRWMDDVIDGTPGSASTVWEAVYAAEQRAGSVTDVAAHDRQLLVRRELAYERTFEVEVPDPPSAVAAWSRQIYVRVANVSSWAMNWRTGIPELWFEPRSADKPVKFNCAFTSENGQSPSVVNAGQRIDLACQQKAAAEDRETRPSDASAVAVRGNWLLFPEPRNPYTDSEAELDVALGSVEAMQQADALIKATPCSERGYCEVDRSANNAWQRGGPGSVYLWTMLGSFLGGVLVFVAMRFLSVRTAEEIAQMLSVLPGLGMVALTLLVFAAATFIHGGPAIFVLIALWVWLLIAGSAALGGVWMAYFLLRGVGDTPASDGRY
jgi:hypothetical protein